MRNSDLVFLDNQLGLIDAIKLVNLTLTWLIDATSFARILVLIDLHDPLVLFMLREEGLLFVFLAARVLNIVGILDDVLKHELVGGDVSLGVGRVLFVDAGNLLCEATTGGQDSI